MESRCKPGTVVASTRSGRGVGLRGNGVQLLGDRGFLVVALLFVTATTFVIEDAHCIASDAFVPAAPTPSTQQTPFNWSFNKYEADALNAVLQKWSKQNPQLTTLLNWSPEKHPCDNLTDAFAERTGIDFRGAWNGVRCTSELQNRTEIPKHYQISVTGLQIIGSNSSCEDIDLDVHQCGFNGIIGQLPLEISNLTNLQYIRIAHNPKLTGPVPVEIFQLPKLYKLDLTNNSLSGPLPSDVYNADCKLMWLELGHNNFSGGLPVSSQGTLFCWTLDTLNVEFNQLEGPLNLANWDGTGIYILNFRNNHFEGTFSINPLLDARELDLSCNDFTSIRFTNDVGTTVSSGLDTRYMPSLQNLNISNNNISGPFFHEFLQWPSLGQLDLSMNHFGGSIDF